MTPIFRKHLRYEWREFTYANLIAEARRSPDLLVSYFERIRMMMGGAGVQESAYKLLQITSGVQFIVQKSLSDELRHVDFDSANFEQLVWPAPAIEFYFEDPDLATILVAHSPKDGFLIDLARLLYGDDYHRRIPAFGKVGMPSLGALCDNTATETSCTLCHDPTTWQEALATGHCDIRTDSDPVLVQNEEEARQQQFLLNLALKVLAYSAIPQYKPQPVTRKQMGRGPKSGVCGRPARPSFRTVYLPRIIRVDEKAGEESGRTRTFKGRRGHLRHLQSEFYKAKRGEWIYVPPVLVEGVSTIYKVRKVTADAP